MVSDHVKGRVRDLLVNSALEFDGVIDIAGRSFDGAAELICAALDVEEASRANDKPLVVAITHLRDSIGRVFGPDFPPEKESSL